MTIEVIRFKSYQKGTLQGFADIFVPKMGLEIYGCSVHMKDGGRWLNLPTKEYKDQESGETKWSNVIRFRERNHYDLFCKAALQAVDKWCLENTQTEQAAPAPNFDEVPF